MNKLIGIIAGILLLFFSMSATAKLPEKFGELMQRAKMTFTEPTGLVEIAPIENVQMNYEFALKYPETKFEIRFAIRPLDTMLKEYAKAIKSGSICINPNKSYQTSFLATIFNVSNGKTSNTKTFDKDAVKLEFNADWGSTAFFEVGKEFGQDYKYCMVVAIHKDDCGDAYIFFLTDTINEFDKFMHPVFHSLQFIKDR
jgi:hypothetical protein